MDATKYYEAQMIAQMDCGYETAKLMENEELMMRFIRAKAAFMASEDEQVVITDEYGDVKETL
jgi:hypothetical protein